MPTGDVGRMFNFYKAIQKMRQLFVIFCIDFIVGLTYQFTKSVFITLLYYEE